MRTDVLIIGGGPAGLAFSIAARQAGLRVIVADCATPPIDKACGEGLLPAGLNALKRLGLEPRSECGVSIRGIRFLSGRSRVEADFPNSTGLVLRRTFLHQQLVRRAEDCGVALHWGVKDAACDPANPRLNGLAVQAEFVVAADGQNSRTRRNLGLDASWYRSVRYGFRQHYRAKPWSEHVEVYWGPGLQAYVTPVSDREIGVAIVSRDARIRLRDGLLHFPELTARLSGAPATSPEMGCLTQFRKLHRVWRNNAALVGDASGSVDCITGEGLSLAFEQALALARAIAEGSLASYQTEHNRISRRRRAMAALLLLLSDSDRCRWCAIGALARQPSFFQRFLAFHAGEKVWEAGAAVEALQFGGVLLGTFGNEGQRMRE